MGRSLWAARYRGRGGANVLRATSDRTRSAGPRIALAPDVRALHRLWAEGDHAGSYQRARYRALGYRGAGGGHAAVPVSRRRGTAVDSVLRHRILLQPGRDAGAGARL